MATAVGPCEDTFDVHAVIQRCEADPAHTLLFFVPGTAMIEVATATVDSLRQLPFIDRLRDARSLQKQIDYYANRVGNITLECVLLGYHHGVPLQRRRLSTMRSCGCGLVVRFSDSSTTSLTAAQLCASCKRAQTACCNTGAGKTSGRTWRTCCYM